MIDLENTYWNRNGKYPEAIDALEKLIPKEGSVEKPGKNKSLERLRKAINCYYDLYNNGLWNRKQSYAKLFGIAPNDYYISWKYSFSQSFYDITEEKMNEFIEAAAKEQNIPLK